MDETDVVVVGGSLIILVLLGVLVVMIYDGAFVKPLAAENANVYCEAKGFDQHKSFTRVGLLSEKPLGIKCEYAERYTDLGVRTN